MRHAQDILQNMQDSGSLPIFRSDTQRRLLTELFLAGPVRQTLSDIARTLDVDPTTVMREVDRLEESGLIAEQRIGRARAVKIDESSPYAAPLRNLLDVTRRSVETRSSVDHAPVRSSRIEAGRHDRRPLPSSRRRT